MHGWLGGQERLHSELIPSERAFHEHRNLGLAARQAKEQVQVEAGIDA